MPCRESCGACCDPVFLPQQMAELAFAPFIGPRSAQTYWIADHWAPYAAWGNGVAIQCTEYDAKTRSCMAYDSRPPVCRDYPFYGREPNLDGQIVDLICGYQAEAGRTVLPIVGVS